MLKMKHRKFLSSNLQRAIMKIQLSIEITSLLRSHLIIHLRNHLIRVMAVINCNRVLVSTRSNNSNKKSMTKSCKSKCAKLNHS